MKMGLLKKEDGFEEGIKMENRYVWNGDLKVNNTLNNH